VTVAGIKAIHLPHQGIEHILTGAVVGVELQGITRALGRDGF
jgi:hypothetical protein